MDVSGSFLELSCARVAIVPVGSAISETRFEELVCLLNSCREVPLNALPRRAALSRPSGSATYSSMPDTFREAIHGTKSPALTRSRSAGRDFTRLARRTPATSSPHLETINDAKDASEDSSEDVVANSPLDLNAKDSALISSTTNPIPDTSEPVTDADTEPAIGTPMDTNSSSCLSRHQERSLKPVGTDLDLKSSEVDASFRMRFEIVRRDSHGTLLRKSPSEWDEFHSNRTWGIIGLCDNTASEPQGKDERMRSLYNEFSHLLELFKNAPIRRLMILSSANSSRASPYVPFKEAAPFSVGFIPGSQSYNATKLEIRAQVTHFAGLVIAAIDRECWRRRESPQTELFLSPIDERSSADRQSKLAKRRAGRLDKLLADSLLLMGSPREALVKYNSAIERAKASSDRLWLAGAMEGWSAAHVFCHIGSGGRVDDVSLTDMLIEHYNEIYKLYQKKRASEPETGAALRLAEYLGTWTSRRKDALSAAQHAASVGEGLKVQKRAYLWEALARFSERMGCRRKAAIFLYRLGRFNASQSSWSSAVELMLAAEGQLGSRDLKPWPLLNRQILLLAAKYAEEANDSNTAARLMVEGLVVSPNKRDGAETDETVMTALQRAQVPSFLPGSEKIVEVVDIAPSPLVGSSFKMKVEKQSSTNATSQDTSGPFIYNPFEAKKRAKAAAVARRTVTWVCNEAAQVSVSLRSRVGTKVSFELIAILFGQDVDSDALQSVNTSADAVSNAQILASSKKHSTEIRKALETSSSLVKTISESVQLEAGLTATKSITVIPKRPSELAVRGLLIRLFGGALVIVGSRATSGAGRVMVNVMPELPILSITCPTSAMASTDSLCGRRAPISVFDGETREAKVFIRNLGKHKVSWVRVDLNVSDDSQITAQAEGLGDKDLLHALQMPGSSYTVTLKLRKGPQSIDAVTRRYLQDQLHEGKRYGTSHITLTAQYEGLSARGIFRESHVSVKVTSEPVILVNRVRRIGQTRGNSLERQASGLVAVELSNLMPVPADVSFSQLNTDSERRALSSAELDQNGSRHRRCLLESGASVRLVLAETLQEAHGGDGKGVIHDQDMLKSTNTTSKYMLSWKLPAFGREGVLDVYPSPRAAILSSRSHSTLEGLSHVEPITDMHLLPKNTRGQEIELQSKGKTSSCSIQVGVFVTIVVRLRVDPSASQEPFELDTNIDTRVSTSSQGQNCVSLVGACHHVPIGLLKRNGDFLEHQFRLRVLSVGLFRLCVYLQAKNKNTTEAGSHATAGVAQPETPRGQNDMKLELLDIERSVNDEAMHGKVRSSLTSNSLEDSSDSSPSDLRRLDLNPLAHVIHPTTVDMYQSENKHSANDRVATSYLMIRAVSRV